jgi:hypothetical protein
MTRKKTFPHRITLPLSVEILANIDALRGEDVPRVAFIRRLLVRALDEQTRKQKAPRKR